MADIHLINPMRNPAGGSEHRTIALFELLGEECMVQVWTEEEPHDAFQGKVPMRKVGPPDKFPRGGNLVFVGTYFSIGGWLQASQARRVILIHNLDQPDRLRQVYGALAKMGSRPEVVYASDAIAASTPEIPGVVHESPIDLDRFSPAKQPPEVFTAGRLSRDVEEKHHPGDKEIYRRLAAEGIRVRIMGGTCLGLKEPGIELLPENAEPAEDFLRTLSAFFYRTHPAWHEAYGRVVFEAMACGLPIVGETRHGYSEKLQHGENALLTEDDEAAFQALVALKNVSQRAQLSHAARQTVESIYGREYRAAMQGFYGK